MGAARNPEIIVAQLVVASVNGQAPVSSILYNNFNQPLSITHGPANRGRNGLSCTFPDGLQDNPGLFPGILNLAATTLCKVSPGSSVIVCPGCPPVAASGSAHSC